ncbi:hypothetical protein IWW34DRAFT_725222 [Fusarium oxysporum f. sp. albedinis]|nr:hypothetical protein IWW34DRAFT_725222 [Fusarium oxysporum f. sp. albedinis]
MLSKVSGTRNGTRAPFAVDVQRAERNDGHYDNSGIFLAQSYLRYQGEKFNAPTAISTSWTRSTPMTSPASGTQVFRTTRPYSKSSVRFESPHWLSGSRQMAFTHHLSKHFCPRA